MRKAKSLGDYMCDSLELEVVNMLKSMPVDDIDRVLREVRFFNETDTVIEYCSQQFVNVRQEPALKVNDDVELKGARQSRLEHQRLWLAWW